MRTVIVLLLICSFVQAEGKSLYPFTWIDVPDSIHKIIDDEYYHGENTFKGNNSTIVYSLSKENDFRFQDGLYVFSAPGPHFNKRLFIYKNKELFIFKTKFHEFNQEEHGNVLSEMECCKAILHLTDAECEEYRNCICQWLNPDEENEPAKIDVFNLDELESSFFNGKWDVQCLLLNQKSTVTRMQIEYGAYVEMSSDTIHYSSSQANRIYKITKCSWKDKTLSLKPIDAKGENKSKSIRIKKCFKCESLTYCEIKIPKKEGSYLLVLSKDTL